MTHAYGIDEQGRKHAATAAKIADEVSAKHAADVDTNARFPEESIAALAEQGLFGLCLPESVGGMGQGPAVFAAVVEELAQRCGSTAMIYVMHVTASQMVAASESLAGKEALLKEIAAGKHLTTLAFSEKGSRSMFWAPASRLERHGDGYKVNAYKSWVTSASRAHSYVSTAQKPDANTPMESTLYLLRKDAPGVRIASGFDGLGLRGNDSSPVSIEGLELSEGDLLTGHGKGIDAILQVVLPWFVVGTSSMALGLSRGAVAATSAHLINTSFDAGTPGKLRDLPNLRARLATMNLKTEQSRALLGHALAHMAAPSEVTPLYLLQARLSAMETAVEVTDIGMKTCGGAAFSKHLPLERLFRDARAGWVMAPTVDHLSDFIGKALTGLPLF